MKTALKLYHYWRSSCSWRVRWALGYKDIPYDSIFINLLESEQRSDHYLKINPTGQVPTLVTPEITLLDSLTAIEWLEENFPNNPLIPSNQLAKSWVKSLTYVVACGTQPIQNLKVLQYVSQDKIHRSEHANHWITKGLETYEKLLETLPPALQSSDFSVGNSLSLADLCLIPQVYNAIRYDVDLKKMPRCHGIYKACMEMPSCIASHPDKFN